MQREQAPMTVRFVRRLTFRKGCFARKVSWRPKRMRRTKPTIIMAIM